MKTKNFTIYSVTLLSALSCKANENEESTQTQVYDDSDRPNIVVFMADDLLTTELSCYGGQNINTPNIDRLASEGVRFNHNYASMPTSIPIRASMYTGLYPFRHGSYQNQTVTYSTTVSVTDFMPYYGYRVARDGKSHFKSHTETRIEQLDGFTEDCNASDVQAPDVSYIEEFMTRDDDPFLLYVCSTHTHTPWDSGDPTEFTAADVKLPGNQGDTEKTRELFCNYLAEIRMLDNEVGMVYEALEDCGKLDDTLIIFLGEQGPETAGGKYTVWYPGVHSAMIARYPLKIKAGSVCNAIVQYEDILPTMIDIAGGTPKDILFDGRSFKDVLYGRESEHRDYAYGIFNNCPVSYGLGNHYSIRSIRDKNYALINNLDYAEYNFKQLGIMNMATSVADNHYSRVWYSWQAVYDSDSWIKFLCDRYTTRPEYEFYDLRDDSWELNNIYDASGEHSARIATMKQKLAEWMTQQKDPGKDFEYHSTAYSGGWDK